MIISFNKLVRGKLGRFFFYNADFLREFFGLL